MAKVTPMMATAPEEPPNNGGYMTHASGVPQNTNFPSGVPHSTAYQSGVSQNIAYPSEVHQNSSYQTGVPQNAAYPPGVPQNTAYPVGDPPNTTFPSGVSQNIAYQTGVHQNTAYPVGGPQNTAYLVGGPQNTAYPVGGPQNTAYPVGGPQQPWGYSEVQPVGVGAVPYSTQPQVILQPPPAAPTVYTWYAGKQSVVLGAGQVVAGILSIIFQSVAIYAHTLNRHNVGEIFLYVPGAGIWTGIAFIISGSFGIAAGKVRGPCSIIAFMVLCAVFFGLFDIFYLAWSVIALIVALVNKGYNCKEVYNDYYSDRVCHENTLQIGSLVICVLCAAYFCISAIWAIVITGKATCCKPQSTETSMRTNVRMMGQAPIPGQVVYITAQLSQQHPGGSGQPSLLTQGAEGGASGTAGVYTVGGDWTESQGPGHAKQPPPQLIGKAGGGQMA